MIQLTIQEIAKVIDGKLHAEHGYEDHVISNVFTDSRTFFRRTNSAFFALKGPRNDGHNYVHDLIKKEVSVFVVTDKNVIRDEGNFILVKDTTKALQKLAAYHRLQQKYTVIGITGSNGKTIVKEWLYDLLSDQFKIVRSPKSYNSQVGVPLSVLLMHHNYDLGIIEAGISMPNEMKNLAKIISPEIGVFTNLGDAHQENFTSREQKLDEKLLLFKKSKKLVFNSDENEISERIEEFCHTNSIECINWSLTEKDAKIYFSVHKKSEASEIRASADKKTWKFTIPFTDRSAIENACHCFATIFAITGNTDLVLPNFERLESVAMRLEIKQGIHNSLLVNDFYNSDLNSLAIALSVLHQQAAKNHLSRQIILSDIQQTGIPKEDLYKQVNLLLEEWHIDEVTGIGPEILKHKHLFSMKGKYYTSVGKFREAFNKEKYKSSAILIKGAREFAFERISAQIQQKAHQTALEIDLNAMVHNLNTFRSLLQKDTRIMVMVKAFSYGSGDVEIAKVLQYNKVDYLAVAVADEGVELRNAGISVPIVIMNPEQDSFQNIIDYQLEPNIYSLNLLIAFSKMVSQNAVKEYPIHLKIDTGMNRLGIKSDEELQKVLHHISSSGFLKIKSVFSHLAASDDSNFDAFTKEQFEKFHETFQKIATSFDYSIERHILNSAGIERFPEKQYDMVRLGIGLYGVSCTGLPLETIGTLRSTISQIKEVDTPETVGYSRKGKVSRKSTIAVVPVGYADGLDRKLGNHTGEAFINGNRMPIIGNICMDMLMLDVTGKDVKVGDIVEFFGKNISISELAKKTDTIPYEILTGISQRVKRIYLQE